MYKYWISDSSHCSDVELNLELCNHSMWEANSLHTEILGHTCLVIFFYLLFFIVGECRYTQNSSTYSIVKLMLTCINIFKVAASYISLSKIHFTWCSLSCYHSCICSCDRLTKWSTNWLMAQISPITGIKLTHIAPSKHIHVVQNLVMINLMMCKQNH